ncbi:putative RING-H2 finger protein ATL69 [Iris pallida]|uniref:RING-H2 finger protein ATL69 n=1 Tax=Iris pallida TaxID=29817 RepID=A0AAX6E8L0_IRIPA|nr:putative RING-H2 finger protein ATL69 [Iris pallida]
MVVNPNLVTTVIGFGMSVAFIVFICARLICGRIRSPVSRGASAFDMDLPSDDFNPPVRSINGLESLTLAAMRRMKYNHEAFPSSEDAHRCSICLEDYQEREILRIMPKCNHNFHLACIDEWLRKQSTCPICRLPLNDSFEAPPTFGILREMTSPVTLNEHSNRSVTPSFQQTDGSVSNRDILDAIFLDIEVSHVESEIRT